MRRSEGKHASAVVVTRVVFGFVCMAVVQTAHAGAFGFLNRIYSPRVAGLGGAFTAVSGDGNSLFINPAGLSSISGMQFTLTSSDHLLDFQGYSASLSHRIVRRGVLSFGILYFDYGSLEARNSSGLATGETVTARDFAFALSYAHRLEQGLSLGSTVKVVHSRMWVHRSTAIVSDVGFFYTPPFFSSLSVALALLNAGTQFDPFLEEREEMPLRFSAGISYRFPFFPGSVYLDVQVHTGPTYRKDDLPCTFACGTEIRIVRPVLFRLGFNHSIREETRFLSHDWLGGFSSGIGIRFNDNFVDYSVSHHASMGLVHHLGVSFHVSRGDPPEIGKGEIAARQPNPPSGLEIVESDSTLWLVWRRRKGEAYNIYAKHEEQSAWTRVNENPVRAGAFPMKRLEREGTYSFRITAVYEGSESEYSEETAYTLR